LTIWTRSVGWTLRSATQILPCTSAPLIITVCAPAYRPVSTGLLFCNSVSAQRTASDMLVRATNSILPNGLTCR